MLAFGELSAGFLGELGLAWLRAGLASRRAVSTFGGEGGILDATLPPSSEAWQERVRARHCGAHNRRAHVLRAGVGMDRAGVARGFAAGWGGVVLDRGGAGAWVGAGA